MVRKVLPENKVAAATTTFPLGVLFTIGCDFHTCAWLLQHVVVMQSIDPLRNFLNEAIGELQKGSNKHFVKSCFSWSVKTKHISLSWVLQCWVGISSSSELMFSLSELLLERIYDELIPDFIESLRLLDNWSGIVCKFTLWVRRGLTSVTVPLTLWLIGECPNCLETIVPKALKNVYVPYI